MRHSTKILPVLMPCTILLIFLFKPFYSRAQCDNEILQDPMVQEYFQRLFDETEYCEGDTSIFISIARQKLYLLKGNVILKCYPISSAKKGVGHKMGSGQTPDGIHRIREKIGEQSDVPYIYVKAKNTWKTALPVPDPRKGKTDLVTTRILWLEGEEEGFNCGGDVDSYHRKIYIHGTPEEVLVGKACSSGCIRMLNRDVIELYDLVPRLTYVVILNDTR